LEAQRTLGFRTVESPSALHVRQAAERALGTEFLAQIDLVCAEVPTSEAARRRWLQQHLLADLAERYRKQGLALRWDDSLIQWLLSQQSAQANQRDWERMVDECISPLLIPYLSADREKEVRSLVVKCEGGMIKVETPQSEERSK